MTSFERVRAVLRPLWNRLSTSYSIGALERVATYTERLSLGDRVILYSLAILVCIASVTSIYALQRSLLVTEPAYGGTLTEGIVGSPRFINPLLALSDADRDMVALTYAGLMGLSGSGEVVPVIAEHYEISPDGKVYTFTIRESARFADGTPITANDVVYTVTQAQNVSLKSPIYANWSGVTVTEVDPRTVRFTLPRPYAPFLELATLGILPARLWQNISDEEFSFSNLQTEPIGAGPFKIQRITKGADGLIKNITLVQNKYYPLGRPYLDKMVIKFYPRTDDLVTALEDGVVESAYDVTTEQVRSVPYARVFGVFWNQSEDQVYTRTEVRKALSLAINREKIIENVLGGAATALAGPVPPLSGIINTPPPSGTDATSAAVAVLESGGWAYDSDARTWTNAKAKLSFDQITLRTSNVPELKSVASAVKEEWEKLGIAVTVELYEPGDLSQNIIRPRKYEALLYGMVTGRAQDLYAFWSSQERNDPGLNIALYANKSVDMLLEHARSTAETEERLDDLQKIEDTIAAEYPAAFLYAPDFAYSVPNDVEGIVLPQIVTPSDRFATVASWYRETDQVWSIFARARE